MLISNSIPPSISNNLPYRLFMIGASIKSSSDVGAFKYNMQQMLAINKLYHAGKANSAYPIITTAVIIGGANRLISTGSINVISKYTIPVPIDMKLPPLFTLVIVQNILTERQILV